MTKDGAAAVRVGDLLGPELSQLEFRVLSGEDHLGNKIVNPRVQKPGLAFAGFYEYIRPGRVQIIGASETRFIATLPDDVRARRCEKVGKLEPPVFIVTKGLEPCTELMQVCEKRDIPVVSSPALSSVVIKEVSLYLEDHLVPSVHVHGVLLEIYGLGVLLIGHSGVGKSECALDLITRGHSLVADDRVAVRKYPNGELIGYCAGDLRHHMELRGLGIVNIQNLFGLAAVRERKAIDLVVELESWDETKAYDRLGLDETVYSILETPVPYIKMPVALGRNLSILVEVAARNHVLKLQGHHSAREFARRLDDELRRRNGDNLRRAKGTVREGQSS